MTQQQGSDKSSSSDGRYWIGICTSILVLIFSWNPTVFHPGMKYDWSGWNVSDLRPLAPMDAWPADPANKLVHAKLHSVTDVWGPESLAFNSNGAGPYTGVSDGRILFWNGARWETFGVTSSIRLSCAVHSHVCIFRTIFFILSEIDPHSTSGFNIYIYIYLPITHHPSPLLSCRNLLLYRTSVCNRKPAALKNEHICGRPLGLKFDAHGNLYIADAYFGLLVMGPQGGVAHPVSTEADGVHFTFTNDLDMDENGTVYFTDSSSRRPRR
jgi:hypothetical protein